MEITVKLDAFEGPIDLLYHLIEKNEINIYDIPIAQLADQYIDFINKQDKNMEAMSEFIVMAATLLEIKSKMLLPKPKDENNEEIDPRAELVLKLEEYRKFKLITVDLKEMEESAANILYKNFDSSVFDIIKSKSKDAESSLVGISLNDIHKAFMDVLLARELKTDKVRSSFNSVERDEFTIEDKIEYIKDKLTLLPKINFSQIFTGQSLKMEIVVTFLALLELIKMKLISVKQNNVFEEIEIAMI